MRNFVKFDDGDAITHNRLRMRDFMPLLMTHHP
jgi:hypothetical protein